MHVGTTTVYRETPSRRRGNRAPSTSTPSKNRRLSRHERVMRLAKSVELYEYRDKVLSALRERSYIPAFGYCAMAMMQWVGTMCREQSMSFAQVEQTRQYADYMELRDLLEQL